MTMVEAGAGLAAGAGVRVSASLRLLMSWNAAAKDTHNISHAASDGRLSRVCKCIIFSYLSCRASPS